MTGIRLLSASHVLVVPRILPDLLQLLHEHGPFLCITFLENVVLDLVEPFAKNLHSNLVFVLINMFVGSLINFLLDPISTHLIIGKDDAFRDFLIIKFLLRVNNPVGVVLLDEHQVLALDLGISQ